MLGTFWAELLCSAFPSKKAFNLLKFRKRLRMLQVKAKIVFYLFTSNGKKTDLKFILLIKIISRHVYINYTYRWYNYKQIYLARESCK